MGVYEENLKILKSRFNHIYDSIIKESDEPIILDSIETRDEIKALLVKMNETEYRLNSSYRPVMEANKWVSQFNFSNIGKTVLMFGLGNGVFARELLGKLEEDESFLMVEPSFKIFQYVIRNFNLTDILGNPRFFIVINGINDQYFITFYQSTIDWRNMTTKIVCVHPQYSLMYPEHYKKFLNTIQELDNIAYGNAAGDVYFGRDIAQNVLSNYRFLREGKFLKEFAEEKYRDIPIIIVSPGPSLKKNIACLQQAKGKSIIIVVDRALEYVLNHNIEPDFVITIDPKYPVRLFSKRKDLKLPMFCFTYSARDVLKQHGGEKIFIRYDDYTIKLIEKLNKPLYNYNPGGSVSNAAFYVCAILKARKIILVGQDLAYDGDTTHLDGENDNNPHNNNTRWVEDIYGNPIKTRSDWYNYLQWFENAIYSLPDIEVIDATEGGAKIKGSKIMLLKDAIDQYCTKEVSIEDAFSHLPKMKKEERDLMLAFVEKGMRDLDFLQRKAKEGVGYCNQILKEYERRQPLEDKIYKLFKKLKNINKVILEKEVSALVDYCMKQDTTETIANIYQVTEDKRRDNILISESAKKAYTAMIDAVDFIKNDFTECYNDLANDIK